MVVDGSYGGGGGGVEVGMPSLDSVDVVVEPPSTMTFITTTLTSTTVTS